LTARPISSPTFDSDKRLHSEAGPAIEYGDGTKIYSWHGTRIPERMGATNKREWKSEWLLNETNSNVKRILIREIGYSKILSDLGARETHTAGDMALVVIEQPVDVEPIHLLKVVCPSTGSFYALRVPPSARTCEEARAWTFGENSIEYLVET
jgi:hypothetical protein